MKKHKLDECLGTILKTFKNTKNKYEAHLKCYPILHRMAEDDEVIFEVFRRNMLQPKFFEKQHCTPDLGLSLIDDTDCFMFVNFFGPNQDKRTDISYSTMHHHDDFMLSTINAKGKGYKSLIFQQGYDIDKEKKTANVELEKFVLHAPRNIEFIDCHTAHTIFYPESMTMTYGLWSSFYPTSRTMKLKTSPFVQKNKASIKRILEVLKLNAKNVGVAQYREDYFYPEDGELKFLSGQILPENGDYFTQNFFHIAKEFLAFDDLKFLKDLYLKKSKEKAATKEETMWIEKTIENETINRNYDTYNMYLEYRNLPIEEYKKVYNF